MLFYNFDTLTNFINNNLISNIKKEQDNLIQLKILYNNKKNNFLAITTSLIELSDNIEKSKLDDFRNTITLLKNSFSDIDAILLLIDKLTENLDSIVSLYDKNLEFYEEEIKANLVEYNKQRDELSNKILDFENTKSSVIKNSIKSSSNMPETNFTFDKNTQVDIELNPSDYNVLTISEKEQKAYLPFFYSEVVDIYNNSSNKYKTLQDVVNNLYVLPLSRFKNSSISRFREAFNLIRKKENGKITQALDLGLELMFKYNLNPIIIAACRNLNELDIYLDCLDENELYDYKCFEIKFEVMPQITKSGKKDTFAF